MALFVAGVIYKVWKYATTPAPLKIPQNPSPVTAAGVPGRMLSEVVIFKSLFKSNRLLWLAGYLFHAGLVLTLLKHVRFFFPAVPLGFNYMDTLEFYPGLIMLGGLALLFLMRLVIDRHFYISVMTDHFLLVLLIAIATTGTFAKHFFRVDVTQVKEFMMGLIAFKPVDMPTQAMFVIHFSLVLVLLAYFPFSKLVHAVGLFFSPTRNQVDDPREKRLVTPWAVDRPEVVQVVEETAEA